MDNDKTQEQNIDSKKNNSSFKIIDYDDENKNKNKNKSHSENELKNNYYEKKNPLDILSYIDIEKDVKDKIHNLKIKFGIKDDLEGNLVYTERYIKNVCKKEIKYLYDIAMHPYGNIHSLDLKEKRTIYKKDIAYFLMLYAVNSNAIYLKSLTVLLQKSTTTLEPILKTVNYSNIDIKIDQCYLIRYCEYIRCNYMDNSTYYSFSEFNFEDAGMILIDTIFISKLVNYLTGSRGNIDIEYSELSSIEMKIAKKTFLHIIMSHIAGSFSTIFPCKFAILDYGQYSCKNPIHMFDNINSKIVVSRFQLKGYKHIGHMDILMSMKMLRPMIESMKNNTFINKSSFIRDTEYHGLIKKKIGSSGIYIDCVIYRATVKIKSIKTLRKGSIMLIKGETDIEGKKINKINDIDIIEKINQHTIKAAFVRSGFKLFSGYIHISDRKILFNVKNVYKK